MRIVAKQIGTKSLKRQGKKQTANVVANQKNSASDPHVDDQPIERSAPPNRRARHSHIERMLHSLGADSGLDPSDDLRCAEHKDDANHYPAGTLPAHLSEVRHDSDNSQTNNGK